MLVEGGLALDRRGADLNRAALASAPALEASERVVAELGSQTADLRGFVAKAERVTAQAAGRDEDLGANDRGARRDPALDRRRARGARRDAGPAPGELDDLRALAPRLTRLARETRSAGRVAAPLGARAGRRDRARGAVPRARRQVASGARRRCSSDGTELLERGEPTLAAFADASIRIEADRAGATRPSSTRSSPAAPAISEGFFVNFPDQAAEPGTQPFDPFADPRRHYWRGAAMFTCQTFGLPIEPGCLQQFLARGRADRDEGGSRRRRRRIGPAPAPVDGPDAAPPVAGEPPADDPQAPDGSAADGSPPESPAPEPPETAPPDPVGDLLDTLLGP